MQVNVQFDSIDEAIIALRAVQEMESSAEVNSNDSGAPRSTISVTQEESEMQEEIAQDAHDAHDAHDELIIAGSLDDILYKHDVKCNPGSTSWNVIGCVKTLEKIYSFLGYEKTDFLFDIDMCAWRHGHINGVRRFDGAILKELAAFIALYWGYGIDKGMLIRHISKAVTSSRPISPGDFKAMITARPGEATLRLYNSGIWGENRFPDLTRREKLA